MNFKRIVDQERFAPNPHSQLLMPYCMPSLLQSDNTTSSPTQNYGCCPVQIFTAMTNAWAHGSNDTSNASRALRRRVRHLPEQVGELHTHN